MTGRPEIEQQLRSLHAETRKNGWAVDTIKLSLLVAWSDQLGWKRIPNRPGDNDIDRLTPTTEDESRPRSLSATYGLRAQPFHTDGAHLRRPPDLVAMHAPTPNGTPTLLWKLPYPPAHVSHGVFLVDAGTDKFLATPYSPRSGLRFDPGCMTAIDQRARRAVDFFNQHHPTVVVHHWTSPGQLLLIDNRRVLHARAAVAAGDEGRRVERVSFQVRATDV